MRAILISGDEYRFTEELREFERYLRREVCIGPNQIKTFSGVTSDKDVIMGMHVMLAMRQRSSHPLLLVYFGHGGESGWCMSRDQPISHDEIASAIASARRPVQVIADCCHAMSLVSACVSADVSPERVSIIGASEAGEVTKTRAHAVLRTWWELGRPHRFSSALHWGASLDHHFFARRGDGMSL